MAVEAVSNEINEFPVLTLKEVKKLFGSEEQDADKNALFYWFNKTDPSDFELMLFKSGCLSHFNEKGFEMEPLVPLVRETFAQLFNKKITKDSICDAVKHIRKMIKQKRLIPFDEKTGFGDVLIETYENEYIRYAFDDCNISQHPAANYVLAKPSAIIKMGCSFNKMVDKFCDYNIKLGTAISKLMSYKKEIRKLKKKYEQKVNFEEGDIYVGACPSDLKRSITKIGKTVSSKRRSGGYKTGYSEEASLKIYKTWHVQNISIAENVVKGCLSQWRLKNKSGRLNELIDLPIETVIKVVDGICKMLDEFHENIISLEVIVDLVWNHKHE